MKQFVKYRLEYYDGPYNGGHRYFDSYRMAILAGNRYIQNSSDYSERIGFDIYGISSDYSSCLIYSV